MPGGIAETTVVSHCRLWQAGVASATASA